MTNKGKLKALVGVFFGFIIILVALLIYAKTVYVKNENPTSTTVSVSSNGPSNSTADVSQQSATAATDSNAGKETIDLKLYYYDADNYDSPKEIRTVTVDKKLFQDDIAAAINKVLSSTSLKLNKAVVNGNEITVDLPKEVGLKFNAGSASGITYTNILTNTILNLPGIEKMKVTVDGQGNYFGDHFSFNGIFSKTKDGKVTFTESDKEGKYLD